MGRGCNIYIIIRMRMHAHVCVRVHMNDNDLFQSTRGLVKTMEEFVSSSLSLLSLEREEELSRREAITATQLQQPKLMESKGNCLLKLKVSILKQHKYFI